MTLNLSTLKVGDQIRRKSDGAVRVVTWIGRQCLAYEFANSGLPVDIAIHPSGFCEYELVPPPPLLVDPEVVWCLYNGYISPCRDTDCRRSGLPHFRITGVAEVSA